jgi:polyphosphate kinase
VPGESENITVRSIVGRFLEHSRIFRFGEAGRDDTEYVIGSADMMPRNLDRRVEAMLRVTDRRLRARLDEILECNFADDALAWNLESDGTWVKVPVVNNVDAQSLLQDLAVARTKARSVDP